MDNQDSQPQLLFETIPASWCPKGTKAEVFNDWQNKFGANATVNIPGLGDINPATITQMQEDIITLQNQIATLERQYEAGTGVLVAGDSSVVVPFLNAFPNTEFDIGIIFLGNGTETAAAGWSIVIGSVTTAGFTVRFTDVPAAIVSFIWWARQRYLVP